MRLGGIAPALLVVASALSLSGCGLLLGQGLGGSTASSGCTGIRGGACIEQAEAIAARHPGATNVDLTCTAPVCDRRGGSGTAVVTLADGTTVGDAFAYVGDPGPDPVPSCFGLAIDVCRTVAASILDDTPPSRRVVAIEVKCSIARCVADKGETEVTTTLADGTKLESGFGWEGQLP